ncbi:MAG: glutamate--cysteine ligase [Alphaproteobacteria bacterium]|nr:glutamate--cysteine ligase [Alphaproteobacteria bacterium]
MSNPSLTRDQLVSGYFESGKPRAAFRVGAEFERHLLRTDGAPLPYFGTPGVGWLLERLSGRNGWEPYVEGGHLIALQRGMASVTLEPGSQFELSGSPFHTIAEIEAEARAFAMEVDDALVGTNVGQVALGYTPFARIEDVSWVPKGRYVVMRDFLGRTGDLAHSMMKGTAAVQATYDYSDEVDCARKIRLATLLGPLTTATFANSPWVRGRPSGYLSWRGKIWTRTDPARTGFPAAASAFTFERWVDWLLQVPMMFKKDRQGAWQFARGQTFGEWMGDATAGPTAADWELHLTSVFPEVRVKRAIEIRGADCVPLPLAMGFAAFWKGLFYDERSLELALGVAERFAAEGTSADRFETACRLGLEGRVGTRTMAAWAEDLVDLADAGLERVCPDDRRWLAPLQRQVASGESPARTLLRRLGEHPSPLALIAAAPMVD